jgi:hypothetical protein
VTILEAGKQEIVVRPSAGARKFVSSDVSKLILGPNQTAIKGVLRALTPSVKQAERETLPSAVAVYQATLYNLSGDLKLKHLIRCTGDGFTELNTK